MLGMRTRDMAVEEAAGEKRRKVGDRELRFPTSMSIQITASEEVTSNSCVVASGRSSDHVPVSCCSSNGLTEQVEQLQFTDFEESVDSEIPSGYGSDTHTSKRRTETKIKSSLPEMITVKPSSVTSSSRTVPAEKLPPENELEEFFASAENEIHKRFKDKYNFDIVTDAPLEGRFEWVEVKP